MSQLNLKLEDFCEFISGFAWSSTGFNRDKKGIPIIRIQNVGESENSDFIYWDDKYQERFVVKKGDILLSLSGSFRAAQWNQEDALLNQRVVKIIPSEKTDTRWFLHILESKLAQIEGMGRHALVNNVSMADLRKLEFLVPPLPEQRRIAAILDKADAIRRKRQQAIDLLETLLKGTYASLVGEQNPDYSNWKEYKIEELAADVSSAMRTGPFGSALKHSEFVDEGIAVLGIDNAVKNHFQWDERRFITLAKYEDLKRYTVRPNDVIITIMGTTGRSAVVPSNIPLAISTKHLATITVNRNIVEPEFLSNAIHCDGYVLRQIGGANRGAIMDGLNLGIIRATKVRVPPMEKQRRFTRALRSIRILQEKCEMSNGAAQELMNALTSINFGEGLSG